MNKTVQPWQNIDYVYGLFSEQKRMARKRYRTFVEKGVSQGRRTDLTGGGLLRSSGGWTALKALRKAGIRVKGDERILGDSDFVTTVLNAANEKLEEKYYLKSAGYDFNRVVDRVAQVLDMEPGEVTAYDKSPRTVKARALLCFWAHRKLGMTTVEISGKLKICQPAASRLSRRGEKMAIDQCIDLFEKESIKT